jgi:hypothetical protein
MTLLLKRHCHDIHFPDPRVQTPSNWAFANSSVKWMCFYKQSACSRSVTLHPLNYAVTARNSSTVRSASKVWAGRQDCSSNCCTKRNHLTTLRQTERIFIVALRDRTTTRVSYYEQDRQCTYIVTLRHVRETILPVEKYNILHILSVCLSVTLITQHAKRMRRVIIIIIIIIIITYLLTAIGFSPGGSSPTLV